MKYKLLAADIDGTLVNSERVLTEPTKRAVKRLIESGYYFVLSTGRPYQGITQFIGELNLQNMPYILYNGAMVMIGGKTVYSLTMPVELCRTIADEGHKRNSTMILWSKNRLFAEADNEKVRFYKSISGVEPIIVKDLADVAEEGVTKFVWYDDSVSTAKYHEEMSSLLKGRANVHPSRVDFLEFVNKDCSKATAMQIICDSLSLTREDCVAVGDGFNDLPMLEFASLGVAMQNANDAVKSKCGYVTDSCDDDGVKTLIDKLLSGELD